MRRQAWILDVAVSLATTVAELALLLDDGSGSPAVAATVAAGGALALRRLAPLAVLATALAAAVAVVAAGETPSGLTVLIALGTVGARCERGVSLLALGATAAAVTVLSVLTAGDGDRPAAVVVGAVAAGPLAAGSWGIGASVRAQRQQREELQARALQREREAIARELHDIVAHSVGVMLVGVRGARDVLHTAPHEAAAALAKVERSGERSVTELQRILMLLRAPEAAASRRPPPSLGQLPALVHEHRATGLAVALEQRGSPVPLPDGIELAAYRIVQEALTNTRRHAAATHVAVTLEFRCGELEVTVQDDGPGLGAGRRGHGLLGMRERVALHGGELDAGPAPGGGFRVIARLPIPQVT